MINHMSDETLIGKVVRKMKDDEPDKSTDYTKYIPAIVIAITAIAGYVKLQTNVEFLQNGFDRLEARVEKHIEAEETRNRDQDRRIDARFGRNFVPDNFSVKP